MGNVRTGLFLQARINSKRLYKKILLPMKGGLVVDHVMRALRDIKADVYALLTTEDSERFLRPYAEKHGFEVFAGSAWDVLARFQKAAEKYNTGRVIRATGDNPLVSADMGNAILKIHEKEKADLSHFVGLPLGTGIEVVEAGALKRAYLGAKDPFEREHITTYIYRNREDFKIIEKECRKEFALPDIKISIDTIDDYRLISGIFMDIYRGEPIKIKELAGWIKEEMIGKEDLSFSGGGIREGNRAHKTLSAT